LEDEVSRKALFIPFYRLVQHAGFPHRTFLQGLYPALLYDPQPNIFVDDDFFVYDYGLAHAQIFIIAYSMDGVC
jgi:hypothetical protein